MIVSQTYRQPHEGKDHFELKIRIGRLLENVYSKQVEKSGYELQIWYEFNFPVIQTNLGPRAYIGDVVVFLVDPTIKARNKGVKALLNIECDGYEGHSSKTERNKNKVRDLALSKGVCIGDEILPCLTKRILVGKYDDSLLIKELDQLFIKAGKVYIDSLVNK